MTETVSDIGEFELIRRIDTFLEKLGNRSSKVTLGMGDDAACFEGREGFDLLVTCDSMVERRHYLPEYISPVDLGRRAMVMNISDIGAMGGNPLYALVSLGLRAETSVKDVEDMYRGFMEELGPLGGTIIGGNITGMDGPAVIDITLIGEVEKNKIVKRSTAKPGDAILVTGYPGQAAAGLRLLLDAKEGEDLRDHPLVRAFIRPVHRAGEGYAIAGSGLASAMIDISDGFAGDLGHICEMSGVGAELVQEKFPLSKDMIKMSLPAGRDIFDMVLGDSDDYELIITCPAKDTTRLSYIIHSVGGVQVSEVGRITEASKGMTLVLREGGRRDIRPSGWDHFRK